MGTLTRQFNAESGAEAAAEADGLFSWLKGEKTPQMIRDVAPKSLVELSDKVRAFTDDAGLAGRSGEAAIKAGIPPLDL
ncbi:MAG: hypothetical protein IPG06_20615 [Haliea sp.]|nr:hypothetical protein [Haliea sp.]